MGKSKKPEKKKEPEALVLKNNLALSLASWLNEQSLIGRESRERSRFVGVVAEHLRKFEAEKKEIIEKYAVKGDDGKFKMKTVDNVEHYDIDDEKMKDLEKEVIELQSEEFVLDVLASSKVKIKAVKHILLNTAYRFGPVEGTSPEERNAKLRQMSDYDLWCDAFEKVVL